MSDRHGIGGNSPPLAERLELAHVSLFVEVHGALGLEALPPIMDEEDVAAYSERAKLLKGVAGQVEKARKAEKDQILRDGRTVDDFFKSLAAPITAACDAAVAAINKWQRAKLDAERKAEAERLAREREAATLFGGEPEPAPVAPIAAKEAARVVSAETGRVMAAARVTWDYEVTDASKLPRDLLMPNPAAIKARIAGLKAANFPLADIAIDGLRVFEKLGTAIR